MNPARPAPGTELARLDDLPEIGARAFEYRAGDALYSLILARLEGEVFGYENDCPHARSPLDRPDGRVPIQQKRYLICSAHGASFEIRTGACAGGPCNGDGLTVVAVRVADGVVVMG